MEKRFRLNIVPTRPSGHNGTFSNPSADFQDQKYFQENKVKWKICHVYFASLH